MQASRLIALLGILFIFFTGCDPSATPDDDDDTTDETPVDEDQDGYTDQVDCDDQDPLTYPGAVEQCDGLDNDCDDVIPGDEVDDDGDGMSECEGDCDDLDETVYEGAEELCDGLDNDCDGEVLVEEQDEDADGTSACGGDCDDLDDQVHPGASEICNAIDDNCDGNTDEGFDNDQDGYTTCGVDGMTGNEDDDCDDNDASLNHDDDDGDTYSSCAGDCEDGAPAIYPGAIEACNGLDDDCDGTVPADEVDADVDTYLACEECNDDDPILNLDDLDGDGYSTCGGDCTDADAGLNPADADGDGFSTCQGDCNDADADLNLSDADGDGWDTCEGDCDDSDPGQELDDTDQDGVTTCDGDCDDANADTYPSASEICDGLDNNCNGSLPADESDSVLDGWMVCENDCDDASPTVNPGATELCDGLDTDCDSHSPADEVDDDGDGWMVCESDCDDAEPSANPGEVEVCGDGIDNDCDGTGNDCVLSGTMNLAEADSTLVGITADSSTGKGIGWGDVNGDGFDDILVGAPGTWGGGNAGAAYLIHGPVYGTLDLTAADAEFVAEASGDEAGLDIAADGDANNDGLADVLIGAYRNDEAGSNAGAAYLLHGPLSGSIDLVSADAKLLGEEENDFAGTCVSWAGDVDGDGMSDALLGAYKQGAGGENAGAAYLLYSPFSGTIDLASSDAKFVGEEGGDQAGISVSGAGDVDADGFDDMLVGAMRNAEGALNGGAAYLLYGPQYGTVDLSAAGAKLIGEYEGDLAGYNVNSAGDVDGDGYDDILVGAYWENGGGMRSGAAYLLHGPVHGDVDLSLSDAKLTGESAYDEAGNSVSSAGDVDGDGFADLLIGARLADTGGADAGAAYLLFGIPGGTEPLSGADAIFLGESDGDNAGFRVSTAGDVDGDGYDDLLITAIYNDAGGADAGAAYLFYGGGL